MKKICLGIVCLTLFCILVSCKKETDNVNDNFVSSYHDDTIYF